MARPAKLHEFEVTVSKASTMIVSIYAKDEDHARQKIADGDWKSSDETEVECTNIEILSVRSTF